MKSLAYYGGKKKKWQQRPQMEKGRMAGSLSEREQRGGRRLIRFLEEERKRLLLESLSGEKEAFGLLKKSFDTQTEEFRRRVQLTRQRLSNLFAFVEDAFAEGNEMLILVTELTVNNDSARFIGQFGCDAYEKHNQELMLSERGGSLMEEAASLNLEEIN